MLLTKLKVATAQLLVVGLLGAVMGSLAHQALEGAHAGAPQQKSSTRNRDVANGDDKTSQEERDRQADSKGRILFSSFPNSIVDPRGLASIGMGEKKENLLFKSLDPLKGFEDGFRISPDGKKVAYRIYQSTDAGPKYAIHIRTVDPAGDPVDMEVDGQQVCWSPDSTQIAVSRGQSGNVIVGVETKKQTEIKLREHCWVTDWSPDGKWFLVQFEAEKGKYRLARMNKGDTEIRKLAGTEGSIWGGRISPDGKRVLFDRKAEKRASNLWVVSLESGKARQVTEEHNGLIRGYSWSPSGKRIAYTWVRFDPDSRTDLFEQQTEAFLMVNDLDGRNPLVLLSTKMAGTSAVHFTFWDWR